MMEVSNGILKLSYKAMFCFTVVVLVHTLFLPFVNKLTTHLPDWRILQGASSRRVHRCYK